MNAVLKAYNWFEETFCIVLLVMMTFFIAIQVFFRYVLGSPLIWSEEAARYTFVWLTFVGAAYTARKKGHVSVEILVRLLPTRIRLAFEFIISIVIIGSVIYILPEAITFASFMRRIGSSALGIPMGYVYAAVPVGLTLISLRVVGWAIETGKFLFMKGEIPADAGLVADNLDPTPPV